MTTPVGRVPGGAYEGAGRQVSVSLRGFSSVIVTSDDLIAAGHAAIGIALAESEHRLVMIADLGGETPPLQALVHDEDAHGIYDSFEFGTSFVRIAREVEGAKNFFVLPSGTESAATESIIGSPRWQIFASEFANADELLIFVVAADAPGIAKLADQVDGMVLVGLQKIDAVPDAHVLARIPHPAVIAPPKIHHTPKRESSSKTRVGFLAMALLVIGAGLGALFGRTYIKQQPAPRLAAIATDSSQDSTEARDREVIAPSNPADSLSAVKYSVEILASNTAEGANFEIQRHGSVMPGATISLVPIGDTESTWYKVHAGAYADSAQAEQLLATLRRRRIVPDSAGSVVRVPLALLLDTIPSQAGMNSRIRQRLQALSAKDVTAYALMQRDGSARIYAGAFEAPQQSALAATALRVAGLTPVLAYRTGRLQ